MSKKEKSVKNYTTIVSVKLLTTFIRSKVFQALLLLFTLSFFLLLNNDHIKSSESFNSLKTPLERNEISVPGQIRTVRIRSIKSKNVTMKQKLILLWTKYFKKVFSNDYYFFQEGQTSFTRNGCEINNCYVTSNKSLLYLADAVLFHAMDLNTSDLPKRHNYDQIWIIYGMESPRYVRLKWRLVKSVFNWTMTYRSDSHIQVKYGEFTPIGNSSRIPSNIDVSRKKKDAIWMVSNCKTQSRREAYVKLLRKYYHVDIYGKCSRRLKCAPSQSDKCYKLLEDYKFYLSFENSICKDYVTEKFFNILKYDIVPVVFGGANYTEIAPPNSFIDATKFPNPEDLAIHLKKIANDSVWYKSFFEWKENFKVNLHSWMCDLCEHIQNPKSVNKSFPNDLWKWWVKSAFCQKWTKKKRFQFVF